MSLPSEVDATLVKQNRKHASPDCENGDGNMRSMNHSMTRQRAPEADDIACDDGRDGDKLGRGGGRGSLCSTMAPQVRSAER